MNIVNVFPGMNGKRSFLLLIVDNITFFTLRGEKNVHDVHNLHEPPQRDCICLTCVGMN